MEAPLSQAAGPPGTAGFAGEAVCTWAPVVPRQPASTREPWTQTQTHLREEADPGLKEKPCSHLRVFGR